MFLIGLATSQEAVLTRSDVQVLEGHLREVYNCSFHPNHSSILATGSGDSTVRIWKLSKDLKEPPGMTKLIHRQTAEEVQVTALDWNA
jgi:WD40 repeat protein